MTTSTHCGILLLFCTFIASVGWTQEPATPQLRTWTDDTGKFKVDASFVSSAEGQVTLRRADGKQITLPLSKLSVADREVVAALAMPKPMAPAKTKRQPLPTEVTDAWKAAGFKIGWSGNHNYGDPAFRSREVDEDPQFKDDQVLPGVSPSKWAPGAIGKLPPPQAPFALHIDFGGVVDADLKEIAAVASIETLTLHGAEITDEGLKQLAPLQRLKKLDLQSCRKLSDAGLKELAALPALELLSFELDSVTNAGLKDLAKIKSLKKLNLGFTKVSDAGVPDLAPLIGLVDLNLSHNRGITDAGLPPLAAFQSLTALRLNDTGVTDAGMKHVAAIRTLEWLEIGTTPITDKGLQELAALKSLKMLYIGSNQNISDAGIKSLQESLPNVAIKR